MQLDKWKEKWKEKLKGKWKGKWKDKWKGNGTIKWKDKGRRLRSTNQDGFAKDQNSRCAEMEGAGTNQEQLEGTGLKSTR